jgi:hypothetical protein
LVGQKIGKRSLVEHTHLDEIRSQTVSILRLEFQGLLKIFLSDDPLTAEAVAQSITRGEGLLKT